MTELYLRDIQTLTDLQAALGRFADGTQECLRAAEAEINRTQDCLRERVGHWQREVEQARREVARAESDLRRCQASGYRDERGYYHQPDCSREARAVERAYAFLRECENHLRTAQLWQSRIEQAVNEYQRVGRRLAAVAGAHTERARTSLDRAAARYDAVLAAGKAVAPPTPMIPVSEDDRLLAKMEQGPVDLSRKTEWGKFAHRAYEDALEKAFPDQAQSEVRVRVTKADGTEKHGRVDSLLGQTVIDYKTHDLDRLKREGTLISELDKIANQLQEYCASPDTPAGATAVVVFEFAPVSPACRRFIEEYLGGRHIKVLWDTQEGEL